MTGPGRRTVLHLVRDLEVGGIQTALSDLAPHLSERGWDTAVVAFEDGPVRGRLAAAGISTTVVAQPRTPLTRNPVAYARQMVEARRAVMSEYTRIGAVAVQAHMLQNLEALIPRGVPLVVSLHNERLFLAAEQFQIGTWTNLLDYLAKAKWFSAVFLARG